MLFTSALLLGLFPTVTAVSSRIQFIKGNSFFCPQADDPDEASTCLLDLMVIPEVFLDRMMEFMNQGFSLLTISRITKAFVSQPELIGKCQSSFSSLHSIHMCLLREQDLCTYYLIVFEALKAHYREWIDWAPVTLGEIMWQGKREPSLSQRVVFWPKYIKSMMRSDSQDLLIEAQRRHLDLKSIKSSFDECMQIFFDSGPQWSMSGFVNAVRLAGSEDLEKAMLSAFVELGANHSLQAFLQVMRTTKADTLNAKQNEITFSLLRFKSLLLKTPMPRTIYPTRPSDMIPLILQRFSRSQEIWTLLEELRQVPEVWDSLPRGTVNSIFKAIAGSLRTEDADGDVWHIPHEVMPGGRLPGWESELVDALFQSTQSREALFKSLIVTHKGRPELLPVWIMTYEKYSSVKDYFQKKSMPTVRTAYSQLVHDLEFDKKLALMADTEFENMEITHYQDINILLAKHYLQTYPNSTKFLIDHGLQSELPLSNTLLKTLALKTFLRLHIPSFETMLILLNPHRDDFLDKLFLSFESVGLSQVAKNMEANIKFLPCGHKRLSYDLSDVYGLRLRIPENANYIDAKEKLLKSLRRQLRQVAGPEFRDCHIKAVTDPILLSRLSKMVITYPRSAFWIWSQCRKKVWNSAPTLNQTLEQVVHSCHMNSPILVTKFVDAITERVTRKNLFRTFLETLSVDELKSLVDVKDPCTSLDIIYNDNLIIDAKIAKHLAEKIIWDQRYHLLRPWLLIDISAVPYTATVNILKESENFDYISDPYLLSVKSSLNLLLKENKSSTSSSQESVSTNDGESEVCAICLGEFSEDQPARGLIHCKHLFHANCIEYVRMVTPKCPICRKEILSVDQIQRKLADTRISL